MRKRGFVVGISVLIVVLVVLNIPLGPLPPISKLLNPSQGVWSPGIPPYATGVREINITQNGSTAHVVIYRESDGIIGIASNQTWAVFYEQGYLEAQYRLEQLDILKRTATGNLSSILGSSLIPMDTFNRELGNYRIGMEEAKNLSKSSYTYMATSEFLKGINSYIDNLSSANLPVLFKLLGFIPRDWNMADLFAVMQLFLWYNSAGGFDPLYFNFALQNMPADVIHAFYPVYPAGVQNPIVPSSVNPSIYSENGNIHNLSLYKSFVNLSQNNVSTASVNFLGNIISARSSLNDKVSKITGAPFNINYLSFKDFGSNNWAVSGVKTNGTGALLANDPHLTTSVPSIWIGFQLVSPGMNVVGVTFPGFPGIILGHNPYIAWGATNGQIQQTYFYAETVNRSNTYKYLDNGTWKSFQVTNETINVKGAPPHHLTIERAVNGVVIENSSATIAMDWTGLSPTNELSFFLNIDRSGNVLQFESNLSRYFKVGIQNWAVADSAGNIGIFSYGNYPIVNSGNPRGVLPGNGHYNWAGFISSQYLPGVYNPERGFVFSANQISVSPNYPYYVGWNYESGYRADEIYHVLSTNSSFNTAKMEKLQLNVHDYTTNIFLKPLLNALKYGQLNNTNEFRNLSGWDGNMTVNSSAATIYNFWIQNYVNYVFSPYMQYYNITPQEGLGQTAFFLGPDSFYHGPLIEDLANWTTSYQNISWFGNIINKTPGNATTAMLASFNQTISELTQKYGSYSSSWNWGNIHRRYLSSFFGISQFSTGTLPTAGGSNTVDASYGLVSDFGPSWRLVVNMSHSVDAVGIYPGGISENPVSPYYSNTFSQWNSGVYYTLIPATAPSQFRYLYTAGVSP